VAAVRAFAQTLRRCTSARAVLQNYTQINQILTDLNCMDFYDEQEQVDIFKVLYSLIHKIYIFQYSF